MREVLGNLKGYFTRLNSYFNPIGRFYLQIQILCRVLVVVVFLDDLFGSVELTCETQQIGCQLSCENRFAPISHQQLWQFELFVVMMTTIIFLLVNIFNENQHKKYLAYKKTDFVNGSRKYEMKGFYQGKDGKVHSVYTTTGYITMLLVRLAMEILCVCLEFSLAKHISQNAKNIFQLKENWLCPTHETMVNAKAKGESIDLILPEQNRSKLFYRDDVVTACAQQVVVVQCWIPLSRNKTYGLQFMIIVIIFQTVLTFLELLVEVIKMCTGKNDSLKIRSQAKTAKKGAELLDDSNTSGDSKLTPHLVELSAPMISHRSEKSGNSEKSDKAEVNMKYNLAAMHSRYEVPK